MARATAAVTPVDTRERILQAALEAFSLRGFDGAKMRDIAAAADVPLGLVQYHFGAKPKLWRAAVDRAFAALRGGLEAILEDPRPADDVERLRLLVRAHVQFAAEHPEFIRLMHEEGKRKGPRMRWLVDTHVKPLFRELTGLIERAQALGLMPPGIEPIYMVYVVVGAIGVIFHQAEECKRVAGIDPLEPAAAAAHARAVEFLLFGSPNQETLR